MKKDIKKGDYPQCLVKESWSPTFIVLSHDIPKKYLDNICWNEKHFSLHIPNTIRVCVSESLSHHFVFQKNYKVWDQEAWQSWNHVHLMKRIWALSPQKFLEELFCFNVITLRIIHWYLLLADNLTFDRDYFGSCLLLLRNNCEFLRELPFKGFRACSGLFKKAVVIFSVSVFILVK